MMPITPQQVADGLQQLARQLKDLAQDVTQDLNDKKAQAHSIAETAVAIMDTVSNVETSGGNVWFTNALCHGLNGRSGLYGVVLDLAAALEELVDWSADEKDWYLTCDAIADKILTVTSAGE